MITLNSQMNFLNCVQENQQKLLPPELHFLNPVCTKSSVSWAGGAYGTLYSASTDPL